LLLGLRGIAVPPWPSLGVTKLHPNIGGMQLRRITVSNVDESEKEMPEYDAYLRSKFWHDELLSLVFQTDVRSGSNSEV
jgi:hypothetical protein